MGQHPMNPHLMSLRLHAQSFGEVGSAVSYGDDGSICFAHKPFCSPLARFSTWREGVFNHTMCKPEPNAHIGGSVGVNVSLAMLAHPPPHHLRSPSMASRSCLPSPLALMW